MFVRMTLATVLLSTCLGAQATYATKTIPLTPALPDFDDGSKEVKGYMKTMTMVAGDLNGDGVPDLVFANELSFLRVYFIQRTGSGTGAALSVSSSSTILQAPTLGNSATMCSSAGANARHRTAADKSFTRPIIYDIDLDGANELIYIGHIQSTKVGIQIYDWNPSTLSFNAKFTSPVDLSNVVKSAYFQGCADKPQYGSGKGPIAFHIVNARGRAYPQDIVAYAVDDDVTNNNYEVFAFDTINGAPQLVSMFRRVHLSQGPIEWFQERGHQVNASDLDMDGTEEIVSGHVMKWDETASSPKESMLWGMELKKAAFAKQPYSSPYAHNSHIDSVSIGDFVPAILNQAGDLVPSPGKEIVAAPQTDVQKAGFAPAAERTGMWVYNALQGHSTSVASPTNPRLWPRKMINYDSDYEFFGPTDPASTSNWLTFRSTFASEPPNIQVVTVADLLGLDYPTVYSAQKLFLNHSSTGYFGNHHLVASGAELPIVNWGKANHLANPAVVSPQAQLFVDCGCDRRRLRIVGNPWRWGSGTNTPVAALSIATFVAQGATPPQTYKVSDDYLLNPGTWNRTGSYDYGFWYGIAAADILDDAREEVLVYKKTNWTANTAQIFSKSEVIVIYNSSTTGTCPRPSDASPELFTDYRRKRSSYRAEWDAKRYGGSKPVFYTEALRDGVVGQSYGISQDSNVTSSTAVAIVAEGKPGVYTYGLVAGYGNLPPGLTGTSVLTTKGGAFIISGTPTNAGWYKFRVKVQELVPPPQVGATNERDYWIEIKDATGGATVSHRPVITRAGFDGAYVRAGQPDAVLFKAWVQDSSASGSSDTTMVALLLNGIYLAAMLDNGDPSIGDAVAGDGIFSFRVLNAGLMLPQGSYQITMLAIDAAGHVSDPWPFTTVAGNPEHTATFAPLPMSTGQTIANTPTIDNVDFPYWTLQSASKYKLGYNPTGVPVTVEMKSVPVGMYVKEVRTRLYHQATQSFYSLNTPFAFGHSNPYIASINLPPAHLGSGTYVLQVQAVATTNGVDEFVSDWWPQLRVH